MFITMRGVFVNKVQEFQIIPPLLTVMNDESWRTKCACAELLAAVIAKAPKEVSGCLPSIMPKLVECVIDSHPMVPKAGEQALKQAVKVVENPDVQSRCCEAKMIKIR